MKTHAVPPLAQNPGDTTATWVWVTFQKLVISGDKWTKKHLVFNIG